MEPLPETRGFVMAEKNKKIEDLIREAFYLKNYPWLVSERGVEYDRSDYGEIADMIKGARNFDEARNIIVNAAQENPALLSTFVDAYVNKNRKEGEDWNKNAFDFSTLRMRPIDIENVILDEQEADGENLAAKANRLAASLGYDVNNKGLNSLIADYLGGREDIQYGKNWFKKGIANDIRKKKANAETYLDFLMANDYAPNVDEEKLVDDLSSILARVNEINYMNERGNVTKLADQLTKPHTTEKENQGRQPNAADAAADLIGLFGAGTIGKSNMSAKTKMGAGAGLGALIDYAQGIADSALTERTYIDNPDMQLKKGGNVAGAIKDFETPLTSAATGLAALMGGGAIGATGGKKIINSVMNSNAAKTVKKKVSSAIDRLFGDKNAQKALEKERRALEMEHGAYAAYGEKSGITPAEDAMNVKRLLEIDEEMEGVADDAIRMVAETGATLLFTNPPKGMKRTTARVVPYVLGDWQQ